MRKVGQKYLPFTNHFREMSVNARINKINDILNVSRSNIHFDQVFPQYPKQYSWKCRNMDLHGYAWEPEGKKKALLVHFNSLNAHTGLTGGMAEILAMHGIITVGFDYPNFGKSSSPFPGKIKSVNELVDLSEDFLIESSEKYPNIPIFLCGMSLGGLITFQVGLRKNIGVKGCIFLNPAFKDNPVKSTFWSRLSLLFNMLFPSTPGLVKERKGFATKYSLKEYKKIDSLMYGGKTWFSTILALLLNMNKISTRYYFEGFELPFLCIQGGTDKMLDPFTVFEFERHSFSKDKEVVIIPDLWHSIWFDDHHNEIVEMIRNWIEDRSVCLEKEKNKICKKSDD